MVVIKLQQNSNYVELAFALCICFVLCHFAVKYIELFGITELEFQNSTQIAKVKSESSKIYGGTVIEKVSLFSYKL